MLSSIRQYVYDRRRGFALGAGIIGSAYLAGRYVVARLEEIRDKVLQDRAARDNLRRRFVKNQEDIAFTVLALLPPLGTHILESMDVERLTNELKSLSTTKSTPLLNVPIPATTPDDDARSESSSSALGESAQSWVDQFNTGQSTASLVEQQDVGASTVQLNMPQPASNGNGNSDSPRSTAAATDMSLSSSMMSEHSETSSVSSSGTSARSKAELWRDVKILTFARTLTVAYATTLLTLLTHVQLSILGRHKYVASVRALNREAVKHERAVFDASMLFDFGFTGPKSREDDDDAEKEDEDEVTEEIERRYLTLSWWLLNEGWREIAGRVRAAVESVFDAVSLKTQLSIDDLALLVRAVRARIDTSDHFLPSLLPPTPSDLARVLGASASFASASADTNTEKALHALLSETRARLAGADFALVLRAALGAAAEDTLLTALDRDLFQPLPDEEDDAGTLESSFGPRIRELPLRRVRLASLLPGVARWAHGALGGYPNELVDSVAGVREVEVFCAIVYSAYDDELVSGA